MRADADNYSSQVQFTITFVGSCFVYSASTKTDSLILTTDTDGFKKGDILHWPGTDHWVGETSTFNLTCCFGGGARHTCLAVTFAWNGLRLVKLQWEGGGGGGSIKTVNSYFITFSFQNLFSLMTMCICSQYFRMT